MRLSRLIGALCAVGIPLLSTLSNAALIDRGGGLIYDDVLDITWLQDTNYALTNGDDDGRMSWTEANAWAAGLSYYDAVRDVTYDDWRLPTLSPIDGINFNITISNDGTTDQGYARTTTDGLDGGWRDIFGTPASELGYMFYVNLASKGKCDPDGNVDPCNLQSGRGLNDTGLFTNFSFNTIEDILGRYATGTDLLNEAEVGLLDGLDYVWSFNIKTGNQVLQVKDTGFGNLAAWAVRDGDVGGGGVPLDSDGDGLLDSTEDSNGNGFVDAGETDPINPDSDGDGLLDGAEDINANGAVDAGETDPTDSDSDSDGLSDGYEVNIIASDPTSPTTVYTNPGDMNGDGDVNVGDLLLLQRVIMGLSN